MQNLINSGLKRNNEQKGDQKEEIKQSSPQSQMFEGEDVVKTVGHNKFLFKVI